MQKLKILICISCFFSLTGLFAQQDSFIVEYIRTYKDLAISEMQRTGVPAAIKLAQGIHETSAGTSELVMKSNNHFGLKCKSDWTGMRVKHTDDAPHECFRKYANPEESYIDQSDYLRNNKRYAGLFDLDPTDYKAWAYGLKKAGYATNPKYSQILIKLIEDYNLEDYTLIAMGKLKESDEILAGSEKNNTDYSSLIIPDVKPVVMPPEPEIVVYAKKNAKAEDKKLNKNSEEISTVTQPVYPDGEFKINDTRVIYARRGTSFLSIAEKFNVPLARIFEFNELKEQEFVDRDQLVYIMRKRKTGLNEQHVVQNGETIAGIAQTEAVRLESLMEYNYLKPGANPAPGTVLYLRTKAPSGPLNISGK